MSAIASAAVKAFASAAAKDPGKVTGWVIGAIVGLFSIFFVLVSIPRVMLESLPLVKPGTIEIYQEVIKEIKDETKIEINWQHLVSIHAVMLKQDFSKANKSNIRDLAERFIEIREVEEEYVVEEKYFAPVKDSEGNTMWVERVRLVTKTRIVKKYFLKELDVVLHELILDGSIKNKNDVMKFLQNDISVMAYTKLDLPPGWTPSNGEYEWPVPEVTDISCPFGPRINPVTFKEEFHTGLDIAAPSGNPVVAARDGKAQIIKNNGTAGNTVIIVHSDTLETRYYHLSSFNVKQNQTVTKGQVIAYVGSTGQSTGPHLHFEIRIKDKPVDPLKYFQPKLMEVKP